VVTPGGTKLEVPNGGGAIPDPGANGVVGDDAIVGDEVVAGAVAIVEVGVVAGGSAAPVYAVASACSCGAVGQRVSSNAHAERRRMAPRVTVGIFK
jgi:hypothetical protein